MAASPVIDRQECNSSTQRSSKPIRNTSLCSPAPHSSPSTRRFEEISKQIISTPIRRSSTGIHTRLLSSQARSSNSGKVCGFSFPNGVPCATSRHSSDYARKDCRNSSSARAVDHDVNRRCSHQAASSSVMTSHGGSHSISSNSKLKHGASPPSSSNTSSRINSFSPPTSSSSLENHGSSNPTSSRNKGDETDSETPRSSHSNRAYTGNKQMHSAHVTRPNIGQTSHVSLQGKLASRDLANTSGDLIKSKEAAPKGIARAPETNEKSRDSATKHRSTNQLCKDCRDSMMESVCFIANDGTISAALTGGAYARHRHHCNVWGCAANRNHYQLDPSPLSKKDSLSKRQAPLNPQPTRRKLHTSLGLGNRRSGTASSDQGDDRSTQEITELSVRGSVEMSSSTGADTHDLKQGLNSNETSRSEDDESDVNTDSLCRAPIDRNELAVFSPREDRAQSPFVPITNNRQSYGENGYVEDVEVQSTAAAAFTASDVHDDVDDDGEKGSVCTDDIHAFNDFKSLVYHGDNECSCSEDGTEASTTPNSVIKGPFDELSNIDIDQSSCGNELSRTRRSTMARMRQRYLESLKEQEAETVRLRKQEVMTRKQAGDWMLDCHMEEVLHRLAPNGETRVKVLVEAFEEVINVHSDSESSQTAHHQDEDHLENLHSYASS